ncbi:MAG: T9SS type A sorting domain-containing protein [Melioribacteraceae bacterium]|nr:T9SS type A sorting domain-containing protein [Melioribacteraceae bacterium]MCF8354459.1 T9SS type A sorting domain-containing protein [Melioribacteraceae bacterium]MCF8394069.1 T9SS type A sorting domain-containing protein [Melioribacteraceae bacterium]MCF8419835.1 T9SS type A sorting domain-containing protein [Melioribacteraceae bacterium]
MKKLVIIILLAISLYISAQEKPQENPPVYIAFLWHMHQPIYWPYESIVQTYENNRYSYNVLEIHTSRTGPYTDWPKNAVYKGINAGLPHLGAQVSFSGSLIENLNNLEDYGVSNFQNWKSSWNDIINQETSLGNPRIDMVAFGYHHPLMGLITYDDIRKQIQSHKQFFSDNFTGEYSKGIFPPENAFAPHIIPALVDEGIEWVLVDNIHFERAAQSYPYSTSGAIYEPNKSDQLNPNPNDWVQLNNLYAPTPVSAKWSRQSHYVEYVDPETGESSRIIAVPTDTYLGNEDGRGGFGALQYESVMSQLEGYNTDAEHPILIVLHHDGDNYDGGSDGYYGANFQAFVDWLQENPDRFVATTVQDYLEMYPPDPSDVIHIEKGSWLGADGGDPEFKKWLGDPNSENYSPDHNSWGVVTAAKNYVNTAESIDPNNADTKNAIKYLLNSEASDYWYWDFSLDGIWDAHPTRASNQAVQFAQQVYTGGEEEVPPTIFMPQREPYNPGGTEWGISQSSDFKIWTYVYDVSGLQSVTLKYRLDNDGVNSLLSDHNETYSGGSDVGDWVELNMAGIEITSQTNPMPLVKAEEFSAQITGQNNSLIDYYVEAVDSYGNISKSPINHVWIGEGGGSTGNPDVSWEPVNPTNDDLITITVTNAGQSAKLHWGVNNNGGSWVTPDEVYWTDGTVPFDGSPAVESPFTGPDTAGTLKLELGPFNNDAQTVNRIAFVIHYDDDSWDNNNGSDYHIYLGDDVPSEFVMDGEVDASAVKVISNDGIDLYLAWEEPILYIATQSASSQANDIFVFFADGQNEMIDAPWGKSGFVAGWSAYMANESDNNYNSWYDNTGTTGIAAGNVLEGTIHIEEEFGFIPAEIFLSISEYQTADNGALIGQLPAGNNDGNIDPDELFEFNFVITDLKNYDNAPTEFSLLQNYPNPFNPITTIKYTIPTAVGDENFRPLQMVILKVFDMLGREVTTLVNKPMQPGKYQVTFDGSKLSSGVYIYRITSGEFSASKKFVLMK